MQFCTECGGALNLFETNDNGICWSCVRKKEQSLPKAAAPQPTENKAFHTEDLEKAQFSCEGDMLILKAPEGWTLWSGPIKKPVDLGTIMKRARRIHEIRKRRNNGKD